MQNFPQKLFLILLEERIVLDAALAAVAVPHANATPDPASINIHNFSPDLNSAKIIYVDQNASGSVHNGTSWNNAYLKLQDALTAAATTPGPDQIWVADGVYSPGNSTSSTYTLPDDVAIYGGFAGNEKSLQQRNSANPTVLDGLGVVSTLVTANHVTAIVDGLTIRNALNTLSDGGGISETNGSNLLVSNTIFSNNRVTATAPALTYSHLGGGIYVSESNLYVIDSTFTGNYAQYGGAIGAIGVNADYVIAVRDSTFTNNTNPGTIGNGGAISTGGANAIDPNDLHPVAGNLIVDSSTFDSNGSGFTGGAIFSFNNLTFNVQNSAFNNNTCQFAGGAVHPEGIDKVVFINDTFTNNTVTNSFSFGGAISDALNNTVLITKSLFQNNSAGAGGGGLDLEPFDGLILLKFNTFINNTAGRWGGALFTDADNTVVVFQNTFLNNRAGQQGGAIWDADGTVSYSLVGNYFNGNTAPVGSAVFLSGETSVNGLTSPSDILDSLVKKNFNLLSADIALS